MSWDGCPPPRIFLKRSLAKATKPPIFASAQFRTCLWSCVGWWGSGQEAGQPPEKGPTAGGEPANPAKRGTRLKATTDRAFSSLSASKAGVPKRLVFLAGRADRDSPVPIDGHDRSGRRVSARPRISCPTAQHRTARDLRGLPRGNDRSRMAGQLDRSRLHNARGDQHRHSPRSSFSVRTAAPFEGMPR